MKYQESSTMISLRLEAVVEASQEVEAVVGQEEGGMIKDSIIRKDI